MIIKENLLSEASKEITGLHTIVIKDGNTSRRFTFQSHKIDSLKKELRKRYGSKVVTKIASSIKKAETNGKLKFFTNDDAVDFEITGDKVKPTFKVVVATEEPEEVKEELDEACKKKYSVDTPTDGGPEAKPKYSTDTDKKRVMRKCSKTGKNKLVKTFDDVKSAKNFIKREKLNDKKYFMEAKIEFLDKDAKNITIDGKPYGKSYGRLKSEFPTHFRALVARLAKDGKTMANFRGNDTAADIVAKADGTIEVNYDA